MPAKGLGRDGRKITRCLYKGREKECPNSCDECAIPLRLMADAALRNGDGEMALALYKKSTSIKKDYAEAWNNMGNLLGVMMRYTEALEAFDSALAADPTYGRAQKGRATTLMNLMRYDEAYEQLQEAMEMYDDESLRREHDELMRRVAADGREQKEAGERTLSSIMEWANDEGLSQHSTVVYVRRVWNKALETAAPVFADALKSADASLTEREAYIEALAACFAAGVQSAEMNETITDAELSNAEYERQGFYALIDNDAEETASIRSEAKALSRKAIVEYRNLSGIAQYERENGKRVTAKDYIECAVAMYLAGACVYEHSLGRY